MVHIAVRNTCRFILDRLEFEVAEMKILWLWLRRFLKKPLNLPELDTFWQSNFLLLFLLKRLFKNLRRLQT